MRRLALYLFVAMVPWLVGQAGWAEGEVTVDWIDATDFRSPYWVPSKYGDAKCLLLPNAQGQYCQGGDPPLDGVADAHYGRVEDGGPECRNLLGCAYDSPARLPGAYHPDAYDPAVEGPISSIDVGFKFQHRGARIHLDDTCEVVDEEINAYAIVKQGAKYYVSNASFAAGEDECAGAGAVTNFVATLHERDFGELVSENPRTPILTSNPNFEDGDPIYFGYAIELEAWSGTIPWQSRGTQRYWAMDAFDLNVHSDNDGVPNSEDNCIDDANPDQCDFNQDGYGNQCDCDFNDDDECGALDYIIMAAAWGKEYPDPQYDEQADMNANGKVDAPDYILLGQQWNDSMPGKSGLGCAGTGPFPCGPVVGTCTTPPTP